MTTVTDEQLGAFLDGECSDAEAARIAALLEGDPDLAARLERLSTDTQMLRGAFDAVLDEPVPAALTAAAGAARPGSAPGTVIDFAAARAARTPRWVPPLAIAASIALGVVVGAVGWKSPASIDPGMDEANLVLAAQTGPVAGPVAGAALAATLASAQSGTTTAHAAAAIKPILTFRDEEGRLCRQFSLQQKATITNGIACLDSGTWRLVVLATDDAPENTDYVTAAGPADAAVEATLDRLIAGEPLDARAEAEALSATAP